MLKLNYNEKCDVWSCGVILYILLCGHPPFDGENDKDILDKVLIGKYNFNYQEWDNVSKEAKDLVKIMLEENPQKRISALDALKHSWIRDKSTETALSNTQAIKVFSNIKNFRVNLNKNKSIHYN